MSKIRETLKIRGNKYGGYKRESDLIVEMINLLNDGKKAKSLENTDKHTLYMIVVKLVRIVNGGRLTARDSYLDIAGYATLAMEHIDGEDKA